MASSPTSRSKAHMESLGYRVAIVEHWNSFTRRRQDLFGIIDLLGVGETGTLAVQATSGTNVSSRVKKIGESEAIGDIRKAGWAVQVWGWTKGKNGRYTLRVVDVS